MPNINSSITLPNSLKFEDGFSVLKKTGFWPKKPTPAENCEDTALYVEIFPKIVSDKFVRAATSNTPCILKNPLVVHRNVCVILKTVKNKDEVIKQELTSLGVTGEITVTTYENVTNNIVRKCAAIFVSADIYEKVCKSLESKIEHFPRISIFPFSTDEKCTNYRKKLNALIHKTKVFKDSPDKVEMKIAYIGMAQDKVKENFVGVMQNLNINGRFRGGWSSIKKICLKSGSSPSIPIFEDNDPGIKKVVHVLNVGSKRKSDGSVTSEPASKKAKENNTGPATPKPNLKRKQEGDAEPNNQDVVAAKKVANKQGDGGSPNVKPALAKGSPNAKPALANGSPNVKPALANGSPNVKPALAKGTPNAKPALANGSPNVKPALANGSPNVKPALANGSPNAKPALAKGSPNAKPALANGSPNAKPALAKGSPNVKPALANGSPNAKPALANGSQNAKPALANDSQNAKPALAKGGPNAKPALAKGSQNVKPALAKGSPNVKPALANGSPNAKPALANGSQNAKPALANDSLNAKPALAKGGPNAKPALAKGSPNAKPALANGSQNAKPALANDSLNAKPALAKGGPNAKPALAKGGPNAKPALANGSPNAKPALAKDGPNAKPALAKDGPNDKPALANGSPNAKPALANGSPNVKPALANGSSNDKPALANEGPNVKPASVNGVTNEEAPKDEVAGSKKRSKKVDKMIKLMEWEASVDKASSEDLMNILMKRVKQEMWAGEETKTKIAKPPNALSKKDKKKSKKGGAKELVPVQKDGELSNEFKQKLVERLQEFTRGTDLEDILVIPDGNQVALKEIKEEVTPNDSVVEAKKPDEGSLAAEVANDQPPKVKTGNNTPATTPNKKKNRNKNKKAKSPHQASLVTPLSNSPLMKTKNTTPNKKNRNKNKKGKSPHQVNLVTPLGNSTEVKSENNTPATTPNNKKKNRSKKRKLSLVTPLGNSPQVNTENNTPANTPNKKKKKNKKGKSPHKGNMNTASPLANGFSPKIAKVAAL